MTRCEHCGGDHPSDECPKVRTVRDEAGAVTKIERLHEHDERDEPLRGPLRLRD